MCLCNASSTQGWRTRKAGLDSLAEWQQFPAFASSSFSNNTTSIGATMGLPPCPAHGVRLESLLNMQNSKEFLQCCATCLQPEIHGQTLLHHHNQMPRHEPRTVECSHAKPSRVCSAIAGSSGLQT